MEIRPYRGPVNGELRVYWPSNIIGIFLSPTFLIAMGLAATLAAATVLTFVRTLLAALTLYDSILAARAAFLAATLVKNFPPIAALCDAMANVLATSTVLIFAPMTTGATASLTPTAAALAARAILAAKIPFPIAAPLMAPVMAP